MVSAWIVAMVAAMTALAMTCESAGGWKAGEAEYLRVGGKVLCQDCTQGWDRWAHGATPLEGSTVAVTCADARGRVVYHRSGGTDGRGEFELAVSRRVNGKELRPEGCSVRLVSSAAADCSVMTDFGGGRGGARLDRPSHVRPGAVRYTVGPFYFTSPMCDEPDASEPGQGKGY